MQSNNENQAGPNLKTLGFNSPLEIIDLLALLKIDGEPVVSDDQVLLNPQLKTQAVLEYFKNKFKVKPNDLPYLASLIKKDIKQKVNSGKN